jgi:hypothetical protein
VGKLVHLRNGWNCRMSELSRKGEEFWWIGFNRYASAELSDGEAWRRDYRVEKG